jgi:DUF4097 and DUF4098 domain-containing protein YvlB
MNTGTMRVVMGAAASAALAMAQPAQAQRQVNERQATGATGTVEITVPAGPVRVTGWSRNEVQVTGNLTRSTDRVQIRGGRGSMEIEVVSGGGRAGQAALEVHVPAGKSLEIQTSAGPVNVVGVTGDVEVVNRGGPVTVEGSPRDVEVTSTGGPVTVNATTRSVTVNSTGGPVTIGGTVRGLAEVNAMSGPVTVSAVAERLEINALSGPVRVTNVSGPIEVASVSGPVYVGGRRLSGSIANVSGGVVVEGALAGGLSVESHSGDVELRLPASTAADVDVTTYSGSFRSDFGTGRRDGNERHLRLGRGGSELSITTFSGNVKLVRR